MQFLNKSEIVDQLIHSDRLEEQFKIELKQTSDDDLILYHSTFGMWIRNTYELWNPDYPFLDNKHPDDFSFEIIQQLVTQLRE